MTELRKISTAQKHKLGGKLGWKHLVYYVGWKSYHFLLPKCFIFFFLKLFNPLRKFTLHKLLFWYKNLPIHIISD
jgi:hypothetical protein